MCATVGCAAKRVESPVPATSQSIPVVSGDTIEKSGMRYVEVSVGAGDLAQRGRCVHTRYIGRLASGKVFDFVLDTTAQGKPRDPFGFVIGQRQVIQGWDIGIEGMREGGYRRLLVPWRLGYGSRGNPPAIPPQTDLVFDIELVKVTPARIGGSLTTPTLECGPWTKAP